MTCRDISSFSSSSFKPTKNPYISLSTSIYVGSQKCLEKRIAKAIAGRKSCPICLEDKIEKRKAAVIAYCMHVYCIDCIKKWSKRNRNCPLCKSEYKTWFYTSGTSFKEHTLQDRPGRGLEKGYQIPTRERALQYRRRVYDENLRAVPYRSEYEYCVRDFIIFKEAVLEMIRPWILRELEVITRIPDPSLIVYVVNAVYFEVIEKRSSHELVRAIAEEVEVDNSFLDPLRPFLYQHTNLFWHELKCFAQCHLKMEEYDNRVQYEAASTFR